MFKDMEEAQAKLWPDRCPECGYMAYVGMNEVKCIVVGSCRNYDEKESQRWVDLREELDKTDPHLICPTLDEVHEAIYKMPVPFVLNPQFDWRDHVQSAVPLNPTDLDNWVYQLPSGESKQVYIGDDLIDANGRQFRVARIDRVTDQITIIKWP